MKKKFIIKLFVIIIVFLSCILIDSQYVNAQTLFNQTIPLINTNFDNNLSSWKNISELGSPVFSWINNDGTQFGIAQISASGISSSYTGSMYQTFNLSIPSGTIVANLTFSTLWMLIKSDSLTPSTVSLMVQNYTNITSCNSSMSSTANTTWSKNVLNTNGSSNCFVQNFTANSLYNVRLRCELTTSSGSSDEKCYFDNVTALVYYSDIESPSINLVSATPNNLTYPSQINFTANITDNIQVHKVWVSISGVNYTLMFLDGIYYYDLFNTSVYPGLYNYTIYANDTSSLLSDYSWNFTIYDGNSPTIVLNSPDNNYSTPPANITFSYTPTDYNLKNCSMYTNMTGSWNIYQSDSSPVNTTANYFYIDLDYGSYLWNIYCCDTLSNCGFSSSDGDTNRTINIAPDIEILDGDVSLSTVYPIHGETVTIYSTLRNLDNINLDNVAVSFYDGDPDFGGHFIDVKYVDLSPFQIASTNTTWSALRGTHDIYVVVNIDRSTLEIDYSNNRALNTTYTPSWHTYYGNTTAIMNSLGDTSKLVNWTLNLNAPAVQANIYVADSTATIAWDSLQALGRDKNNQSNIHTTNDYAELDSCLNSTTYPDSIATIYSNITSTLSSYTVYSRTINNVPDAQSTNNTNFYTGIFWDTSIGYDYYNCSSNKPSRPNIVFATKINHNSGGKYGTYDYEMRVPEEIGDYKGSTNKVNLYYELT